MGKCNLFIAEYFSLKKTYFQVVIQKDFSKKWAINIVGTADPMSNKKFELMLTRRVKAYSSSRSVV